MKKVIFALTIVLTAAITACNSNPSSTEPTSIVTDSAATTDSISIDSVSVK